MTRNALTIRTDDGDHLPPFLFVFRLTSVSKQEAIVVNDYTSSTYTRVGATENSSTVRERVLKPEIYSPLTCPRLVYECCCYWPRSYVVSGYALWR